MKLAFYNASQGRLLDRLIAWRTDGQYSHVELVFSDGICFSSSPRDGGTRFKEINLKTRKWQVVDIGLEEFEEQVMRFCARESYKPYDWLGVMAFALGKHPPNKNWFCSEVCVAALQEAGMFMTASPGAISPQTLYHMAKAWSSGCSWGSTHPNPRFLVHAAEATQG